MLLAGTCLNYVHISIFAQQFSLLYLPIAFVFPRATRVNLSQKQVWHLAAKITDVHDLTLWRSRLSMKLLMGESTKFFSVYSSD